MKTLSSLLVLSSLCFGATLSNEPTDSSLVIYNGNRALVHEIRDLKLSRDDTIIVYNNVANTIDTDSVNVKLPQGVKLYSQHYRYDKLTLQKMLEVHIGKTVNVKISTHKHTKATLLSVSNPYVLVKDKYNKIIPVKFENITFDNIPKDFIINPSLIWNINAQQSIRDSVKIDYLITNLSFKSSYILELEKDSAKLSGYFSIDNRSEKDFKNTSLALLAGDVNFAASPVARQYKTVAVPAQNDSAIKEESYAGYHYYKLPFKVDLPHNEKTQIKFLSLQNIAITRKNIATLSNPLYFHGQHTSDVMQEISFKGLKQVLPKGVIRVYDKKEQQNVLVGERSIHHTPKNTPLHLGIGKAFDLKVKQTLLQRDQQQHRLSTTLQYVIKNDSNQDKTVTLRIPFSKERSAKVYSEENYTYTKGNFVTFTLTIKANSTKKFTAKFERKR